MADDDKANKGENDKDESEEEEVETDETDDDDDDSGEGDKDKAKKDPELEKAIRRRDRVLAENRRLKAQIAADKDKGDDKDKGPSAEEKANARIVRSSARAVLAANGVTSKDDQAAVLSVLNLADIEVDDDGDPDEDAIEERVEELKRIFGGEKKTNGRVPRTTSTKDKGGATGGTSDSDSARYRRFITGR